MIDDGSIPVWLFSNGEISDMRFVLEGATQLELFRRTKKTRADMLEIARRVLRLYDFVSGFSDVRSGKPLSKDTIAGCARVKLAQKAQQFVNLRNEQGDSENQEHQLALRQARAAYEKLFHFLAGFGLLDCEIDEFITGRHGRMISSLPVP